MLGSSGKSITALAIMQLVENGLVHLDAQVVQYLPWFRAENSDLSNQITIRHLLTHTSGFPLAVGLAQMDDGDTSESAIEKHVRGLSRFRVTERPGSRFQYCNANYIILGMIIQAVSNKPYEDYIQTQIFDPLGMKNSFISWASARKSGLATAHQKWFGKSMPVYDLPFVRGAIPAGYHMCSAKDMANYLIIQLNSGRYQGESVIRETGMALMHNPAIEAPGRGEYAFGWTITELGGTPVIKHGGAAPGYLSDIILVPDMTLGVVLLTNTYTPLFSMQMMEIADNIARMLLGQSPVEIGGDQSSSLILIGIGLILVLQIAVVFHTVKQLKRWRSNPSQIRFRETRFLVLPLLLGIFLGLFVFVGIPQITQIPLSVVLLFQPDAGWMLVVSGTIAFIWGLGRHSPCCQDFMAESFVYKGNQRIRR